MYSVVADDLLDVSSRLRSIVAAEIMLLMASALNMSTLALDGVVDSSYNELHSRQLSIAVITEMIHMAVLAGDVLLSRALVALSSLGNNEVVDLIWRSVQHLVTGETMQMTAAFEQRCSMEYYMKMTYNNTAALISNSCQAVSIITGQTAEVSMLAYDYGWNMGVAFQLLNDIFTGTSASLGKGSLSDIRHGIVTAPILFAMEEFPQLRKIVERGFHNPADVDLAAEILGKSNGLQRAIELASEHANIAAAAIISLPETDNADVRRSRQALVDLTRLVITRK